MNKDFPRILTLLREEKGLSQKKAASDLGISQPLLSHYEKGIRECGLDFVVKVADYYDVSCDYLLGRTPEPGGKTLTIEEIPDGSSIKEPIRGEYGILVPDMDQEENFDPEYITEGERLLAQEMEAILDDEELLKKYSGKAFERASVFAPDKYKDSIHEIFKRYE